LDVARQSPRQSFAQGSDHAISRLVSSSSTASPNDRSASSSRPATSHGTEAVGPAAMAGAVPRGRTVFLHHRVFRRLRLVALGLVAEQRTPGHVQRVDPPGFGQPEPFERRPDGHAHGPALQLEVLLECQRDLLRGLGADRRRRQMVRRRRQLDEPVDLVVGNALDVGQQLVLVRLRDHVQLAGHVKHDLHGMPGIAVA
jgi:hypothetical protein